MTTVDYPSFDDKDFYRKIYHKREYYENRYREKWWEYSSLLRNDEENSASSTGGTKGAGFALQPHQKLTPMYLGPHTPYNGCFLFHGVGTGKTICAFSCIEGYKIFMDEHLTKSLILTPSELILNDFMGELLGRVTKPDGSIYYEKRSSGNRYVDESLRQRLNKKDITTKERYDIEKYVKSHRIGRYYEFQTHMKFVNSLKDMSDESICVFFSNRVIIVDEIHKARNEKLLWSALRKILTVAFNLKIIFLSATSSFDSARELCPTINLLRLNDNLKDKMYPKLIDSLPCNDSSVIKVIKPKFRSLIKGYVSFLRGCNPFTFPERIEMGVKFQKNINFCTIRCHMHPVQLAPYLKSFRVDFNPNSEAGEANELWKNTRKISRMYKPDKCVESELCHPDNIAKYSTKNAEMWKIIINTSMGKGPVLIYLFNLDTGIHDVEEFMKYNNVTEITPLNARLKGPKYVNLSRNHAKKWIEFVLELCKSHENYKGDYIKFILGSGKIRTGLTFRHVSQIHVLEPDWNIATTEQLIGRGCRHLSHVLPSTFFDDNAEASTAASDTKRRRINDEGERPKVEIFRYRATFRDCDIKELSANDQKKWNDYVTSKFDVLKARGFVWKTKDDVEVNADDPSTFKIASIDDMMYKIALSKDLHIKVVERELSENAWDASLQIYANYFPDIEGSEIDYTRLADYRRAAYMVPLPNETSPTCVTDIEKLKDDDIDDSTFGMLEWTLLCNDTVDKEVDSISLNYIDEEIIHNVVDLFKIRTKWTIRDMKTFLCEKYSTLGRASIDWKIVYTILEYYIRQQIPIIFDNTDLSGPTFVLGYANNVYFIRPIKSVDYFESLCVRLRLRDYINYDTAIEDFFEHVIDLSVDLQISKFLDCDIFEIGKDLRITLKQSAKMHKPPIVTGAIINTVDKPNLYRLEIWTGENKLAAQSIGTNDLHQRLDMINVFSESRPEKKQKSVTSRIQKSKLSSKISKKLGELNLFLPWALSTSKISNSPTIYRIYKASLYWYNSGHVEFKKIIDFIEKSVITWMSGNNKICDWIIDVVIKILQTRQCIPMDNEFNEVDNEVDDKVDNDGVIARLKERLTNIFVQRYNNKPDYLLLMIERMHGKRPKRIHENEWRDIVVEHYKEYFLKPKSKWINTVTEIMYSLINKHILKDLTHNEVVEGVEGVEVV